MHLTEHFTLEEMVHSATATALGIDNSLSEHVSADRVIINSLRGICRTILEPVREHYGKPITPSSGYRCAELNKAVNGSTHSQHRIGEAVDFEVDGVPNLDLAYWLAVNIKDFDQIILERYSPTDPTAGWVHVSSIRRVNRKECLTMGPSISVLGLPSA